MGRTNPTYHDIVDELSKMPRIRDALDLDLIPAPRHSVPLWDGSIMADSLEWFDSVE